MTLSKLYAYNEGMKITVIVRWESLSGAVSTKKFSNWTDAQEFADKKELQPNIQWVDTYEKEDK